MIPAARLRPLPKPIRSQMTRSFRKLSISSHLRAWILPMITKSSKIISSFQKKIEDCLFCFEDFQYLDDRAIQKVLRDTDMQELAKALRGASTEVQDKIFRNMSQRAAAMLKEDSGSLYIYRNEPAIFGLENRRDKTTTLNLQKSSPGKIRTYTTRSQRLAHYQLCYRRRPCQKYSRPK